jgi:hypothetical protein
MLPSSPPQALSFAEPRGKEVTSLEKVLVSAGCDRSGEISKGTEVCDWTGTGSSVMQTFSRGSSRSNTVPHFVNSVTEGCLIANNIITAAV